MKIMFNTKGKELAVSQEEPLEYAMVRGSSSDADLLLTTLNKDAELWWAKIESMFNEQDCAAVSPQSGGDFSYWSDDDKELFASHNIPVGALFAGCKRAVSLNRYVDKGSTDESGNTTLTWNEVDNLTTDVRLKDFLKKTVTEFHNTNPQRYDLSKPQNYLLYKGNHITHSVEIYVESYYSYYIVNLRCLLTVSVNANTPFMKKLMQALNKDESWIKAASSSLRFWWDNESFPIAFDVSMSLGRGNQKLTGLVKIGTSFFYIPTNKEQKYDNRSELLQRMTNGYSLSIPENRFVGIDTEAKNILFTNSSGDFDFFSIASAMKVSPEDKYSVLKRPFNEIFDSRNKGSLLHIYDYARYLDTVDRDFILDHYSDTIGSIPPAELKSHLKKLEAIIESRKDNISPITYYSFKGLYTLIYDNCEKYSHIEELVISKKEAFNNASATDVPSIPCISDTFGFFPHQAEALAKLNKAREKAVLDVSTGGGKTIIAISDILNLMAQGKVTRAMVVMPNGLCGQYASEVLGFTNGQVNPFVISTETMNSWGEDKIWEAVEKAPSNTIFIVSYDFLSNPNSIEMVAENFYIYHNVEAIKQHVRPDYVLLDEGHYIKNTGSNRNKAVMGLADVEYKRVATGTLITNNPMDLPGQMAFLDPMAVGDKDEFQARYAIGGKMANGWKKNAAELIRADIRNNMYYLNYRERDWAAFLPDIEYKDYFVPMTTSQIAIYKSLVTEMMEEITKDPALLQAWIKFTQSSDEEVGLDNIPATLLPMMQKLEMFLTAPDSSNFVDKVVQGKDRISCKIEKIDELIDASLEKNQKVIVGVHFKVSAQHLMSNSRHKDISVYYDASNKKNLVEFKNNPNVKVMFCVLQSLAEGHNLQMANRIIIADIDWTPGKLKQFIARIYRPSIKKDKKTGQLVNSNKGKTVYIDTVLANNSADCLKWAFQTHKKIFNANIMEACPVEKPRKPPFSHDAFVADFMSETIGGAEVKGRSDEYNTWLKALVAQAKKANPNPQFIKPPKGADLDYTETMPIPWVRGMQLPLSAESDVPLAQWLADKAQIEGESSTISDLRPYKKTLENLTVRTDSGLGVIKRISKNSIGVRLEDGTMYTASLDTLIKVDSSIKIDSKKAAKVVKKTQDKIQEVVEEPESNTVEEVKKEKPIVPSKSKKEQEFEEHEAEDEAEDKQVELEFALINNIASVIAWPYDPDTEDFDSLGFKVSRPTWEFHVTSKKRGLDLLNLLTKKYEIPTELYEACVKVCNETVRGRFVGEVLDPTELKNFYKLVQFRKASKGKLKVYPVVWFDECYFVVDVASHPGVTLTKYKFTKNDDEYWYKLCKNSQDIKSTLRSIRERGLAITNLKAFRTDARESGYKI